jgi:hypothetical protein
MTITTDMNKAGLEPGCKVNVKAPYEITGSLSDWFIDHINNARHFNPWTLESVVDTGSPSPRLILQHATAGEEGGLAMDMVERDYDDAQAARHTRFKTLHASLGGDVELLNLDEPMQRYVCAQKRADGNDMSYMWGDTVDEALAGAGDEMLGGAPMPEGVYDLDTGVKIELGITAPRLFPSEDQGLTVNELDADEVHENKAYVSHVYDLVGVEYIISVTIEPEHDERFKEALETLLQQYGIEHATVNRGEIRQLDLAKSAAYEAGRHAAGQILEAARQVDEQEPGR